jgi:hypothetical protein
LYPWLLKFAKLKNNFGNNPPSYQINQEFREERKYMSMKIGEDLALDSISASLTGSWIFGRWPHLQRFFESPWLRVGAWR